MREIKFRAWDNKNKKWLLGYEYPSLGGFDICGETMLFGEWSNVINQFILQQKEVTSDDLKIMQYTGIKDMDGDEIYEGDIIKLAYGIPISFDILEIVFTDNEVVNDISVSGWWMKNTRSNGTSGSLCSCYKGDIAIIGNIYANPELLER